MSFAPYLINPRHPKRPVAMPDFQRAQLLEATPIKLDAEDYHHPHPVRRNAQPLWIVGIDRGHRRVMLQFGLRSPLCYWTTPEAAQAFLDRVRNSPIYSQ